MTPESIAIIVVALITQLAGYMMLRRQLPLRERELNAQELESSAEAENDKAAAESTLADVEMKRLEAYDKAINLLRHRDEQIIAMNQQLMKLASEFEEYKYNASKDRLELRAKLEHETTLRKHAEAARDSLSAQIQELMQKIENLELRMRGCEDVNDQ